jgi:hypothetical protein
VALSGTGVLPVASVSPGSLSFSSPLNIASATQTVTLTNSGTGYLVMSGIVISGKGSAEFTQTNTCPAAGASLGAGDNCNIYVTFNSATTTLHAATLNVDVVAPGISQTVALTGALVAPVSNLSASSLSFGNQALGTVSAPQTVTFTNNSPLSNLTISGIASTGEFFQSNTCGPFPVTLAPAATCTISVRFLPVKAGAVSGKVTVSVAAPGSPMSVALSGTGVAPITVSPVAGLAFGQVDRGANKSMTLTVTNPAGNPVLASLSAGLSGSGDFSIASGTCGASLAAGSCTITVIFAPPSGEYAGTGDIGSLTISGSQSPVAQSITVPLTGIAK